MAKSKKAAKKTAAKKMVEQENFSGKVDTVEARPQHEGKDPLAGGERLHNLSNSSDAKTYAADHNELDSRSRAPVSSNPPGQGVTPAQPAHKIPNSDAEEQDAVAKGRVETPAEIPHAVADASDAEAPNPPVDEL